MTFLPSSGKSFILGRVDEAVSDELGLGELAGLTVANEADNLAYDVSATEEQQRATVDSKRTLPSLSETPKICLRDSSLRSPIAKTL